MIENISQLRPRYGEVDKMGYVYHANYVSYCHEARTECMRKMGLCDRTLEEKGYMLPVIEMTLKHLSPAYYDELLTIKTKLIHPPSHRLNFLFEIYNPKQRKVCEARTTVVFVRIASLKPCRLPEFVAKTMQQFSSAPTCNDLPVASI